MTDRPGTSVPRTVPWTTSSSSSSPLLLGITFKTGGVTTLTDDTKDHPSLWLFVMDAAHPPVVAFEGERGGFQEESALMLLLRKCSLATEGEWTKDD